VYLVIWEYQVKAERVAEFKEIYSATGAWAKLFQKCEGFLGTELLVDEGHPRRFLTIDRWASAQEYEFFLAEWKIDYAALDAECEGLTEQENLIGRGETY